MENHNNYMNHQSVLLLTDSHCSLQVINKFHHIFFYETIYAYVNQKAVILGSSVLTFILSCNSMHVKISSVSGRLSLELHSYPFTFCQMKKMF